MQTRESPRNKTKRLVEKNGLKIVKSYGGGKFKYFPIFSIAIFYILEKSKVRR